MSNERQHGEARWPRSVRPPAGWGHGRHLGAPPRERCGFGQGQELALHARHRVGHPGLQASVSARAWCTPTRPSTTAASTSPSRVRTRAPSFDQSAGHVGGHVGFTGEPRRGAQAVVTFTRPAGLKFAEQTGQPGGEP
jgi:hypothetical protein